MSIIDEQTKREETRLYILELALFDYILDLNMVSHWCQFSHFERITTEDFIYKAISAMAED